MVLYAKCYFLFLSFKFWVETWPGLVLKRLNTHFGKCSRLFKYSVHKCTAGMIIINIKKYKAARIKWVLPPPCACVCVSVTSVSPKDSSESHLVCLWEMDSYFYARAGFHFKWRLAEVRAAGLGLYTDLYPVSKVFCS